MANRNGLCDVLQRSFDEVHFGRLVEFLEDSGLGGARLFQIDRFVLLAVLGQLPPDLGRRIDDRRLVGERNARHIDQVQRGQELLVCPLANLIAEHEVVDQACAHRRADGRRNGVRVRGRFRRGNHLERVQGLHRGVGLGLRPATFDHQRSSSAPRAGESFCWSRTRLSWIRKFSWSCAERICAFDDGCLLLVLARGRQTESTVIDLLAKLRPSFSRQLRRTNDAFAEQLRDLASRPPG